MGLFILIPAPAPFAGSVSNGGHEKARHSGMRPVHPCQNPLYSKRQSGKRRRSAVLPQFRVPLDEAVIVQETDLRGTVVPIFEKMGVTPEDARLAADVLVLADLRGVDTHGVSNMLRSYVSGYQSGQINPRPDWKIVRETPATANVDSDRGLGVIIAPKAMEIAIQKARQVGLGMVTIGNGRHLGMASYHAMMALEHDMIGTCMTSCPPSVLPTFGAEPVLGTNPIAVAVPARNEPPFVFDAATSTVAANKMGIARRLGVMMEAGWMADSQGNPVMEEVDPSMRESEGYQLLPLGSTRELGSHKGYGLSCVVDILAGVLTGVGYGAGSRTPQLRPLRGGLQHRRLHRRGQLQGHDGRVAVDDEERQARAGPRPGIGGRSAGSRGRGSPPRRRHPLPHRSGRLDARHLRRVGGGLPGVVEGGRDSAGKCQIAKVFPASNKVTPTTLAWR